MKALAWCCLGLAIACAPPEMGARPPESPAPSVAGVNYESGVFEGVHATKLFEQSWHPTGDARAVLVIHHGLKSHSAHYAELAARLVKVGFAVYAYDMRGHGRSAGQRASLDDFGDLVADLSSFVERVRARESGKP